MDTPVNADLADQTSARIDPVLQRFAHLGVQVGILVAFLAGLRRRDPSVLLNGVLSLGFSSVPAYLERGHGVRFRPWQRLWISTAALVHAVGMLGPYDRIWWWDHLAHTLSSAVVGAAVDVFLRTDARRGNRPIPATTRTTFVLGVTFGFGLVWEVLEYVAHVVGERIGLEPLLVHYGRVDMARDLIFNLVGASLVVVFGHDALSNFVESVARE